MRPGWVRFDLLLATLARPDRLRVSRTIAFRFARSASRRAAQKGAARFRARIHPTRVDVRERRRPPDVARHDVVGILRPRLLVSSLRLSCCVPQISTVLGLGIFFKRQLGKFMYSSKWDGRDFLGASGKLALMNININSEIPQVRYSHLN